jgi:hypothetical protein
MPIHPLKGLELKLVGMRRDHLARQQTLLAEVEDGSHIVLPINWTDRGSPWVCPRIDGKDVKLCSRGLTSLGQAVETALRQKLGPPSQACPAYGEAEHAEQSQVLCRDRSGGCEATLERLKVEKLAMDQRRSASGVTRK